MAGLQIAPAAERDMEAILTRSQEQFGELARLRYEALLAQAIRDVANNPELLGSYARPELTETARTYHLYFSRNRTADPAGNVKRPRHFLVYRLRPDGGVEIGRVLHDRVDLARHLPHDYHAESTEEEGDAERW